MNNQVLVIDDDKAMCELIHDRLTASGVGVEWRLEGRQGWERAREIEFDAVITDINLGGMDGLELCRQLTTLRPETPVIVITGFADMSAAVSAIRAGAYDFISKPLDLSALCHAVKRAADDRRLHQEVKRLKGEMETRGQGLGALMGSSPAMHKVYDLIRRVATTDTTVLLSGESGTGKEVAARTVHLESERARKPFVGINCAAVPANLIESELFGHVRRAFTDASITRKGLFEQARGGTLLLDEVGELPLQMQPKLLRVLQERQVRPLGSNIDVPVDVRIIAASNRDLESHVESGRFREDLYYRLNVVQMHLPPLRARGNDVLLLASKFVRTFAERMHKPVTGISSPTARKLLEYDWPGNVRQLENCIERAVALTRFEEITPEDLPGRVGCFQPLPLASDRVDTDRLTLDQLEEHYIQRVLEMTRRNKTQAAKVLGLDRRTLYRKLEGYRVRRVCEPNAVDATVPSASTHPVAAEGR